jgi:hypothetical protein
MYSQVILIVRDSNVAPQNLHAEALATDVTIFGEGSYTEDTEVSKINEVIG